MSVTDALLAFTLAATLLTLTPGLDTALILRTEVVRRGVAYLCWLGIQLLLRPRQSFSLASAESTRANNWFLRGMLGNVLNPKMGVFYVSFLPQFIPSGHSPILWTFLLVSIHVVLGTLWSLTLILATRYASGVLRKPGVVMWMDRLTGCVFLLFAAKLAISRR